MWSPVPLSISILPATQRDLFELWNEGLVEDTEVAARLGDAGLAVFVARQHRLEVDYPASSVSSVDGDVPDPEQ